MAKLFGEQSQAPGKNEIEYHGIGGVSERGNFNELWQKKKEGAMCQSIGEKVNNPSKTQEEQRLKSTEDGNKEGGKRRGRVIRRDSGRREDGFRWDDGAPAQAFSPARCPLVVFIRRVRERRGELLAPLL